MLQLDLLCASYISCIAFLGALAGSTALEKLTVDIDGDNLNDLNIVYASIFHLPRLRKLRIVGSETTRLTGSLAHLTELTCLELWQCALCTYDLPPNLSRLRANNCNIYFDDVGDINLPALQQLHIRFPSGLEYELYFLDRLTALTSLCLSCSGLLDLPAGLSALTGLRQLSFCGTPLLIEELEDYDWQRHSHQLTALSLRDAGLHALPSHLTALESLECLDLARLALGDAGVAAVGALRKLSWLSLANCGLTGLPGTVLALPRLKVRAVAWSPVCRPSQRVCRRPST